MQWHRALVALVDRAADPKRRFMRWAGVVLAAAALVGLIYGIGTAVIQARQGDPVDEYIVPATEPDLPSPPSDEPLGISEGMTIDQVSDLLPADATIRKYPAFGTDKSPVHEWEWDGVILRTKYDVATDAVLEISLMLAEDANHLVLLPNGLVLGRSTIADVIDVYGRPFAADVTQMFGRLEIYVGVNYGAENASEIKVGGALSDGSILVDQVCMATIDFIAYGSGLDDEGEYDMDEIYSVCGGSSEPD